MPSEFEQEFDLFCRVSALPLAERDDYLTANVPSELLRHRILDLIKASSEEDHLLEKAPFSFLEDLEPSVTTSAVWLADGTLLSGRYRIQRHIASGAFGAVYRAADTNVADKVVTIKVLQKDGGWVLEHFELEQKSLARLRHPGIVSITDSGTTPHGKPFIVLEFIDGFPLDTELRTIGKIQPARAARIIGALGEALQYLHNQKLVHRDLKPSNIMLSMPGGQDERVVLIDFGITKELDADQTSANATAVVGTRDYWAPEQALRGRISPQTDTFAFGLVVFEILTGKPFRHIEPQVGQESISIASELRKLAPDLALDVGRILEECVAPRTESRPARIADAARQIAGLLTRVSPPPVTRRSMLKPAAAGLGLGTAVLVGVSWYWSSARNGIELTVQKKGPAGWSVYSGGSLAEGDLLRIVARPLGPVCLYALSPDRDGKLYVIYPLRSNPRALVTETMTVPDTSEGLQIDASGNSIELWIAIAREPVAAIENSVAAAFRRGSDEIVNPVISQHWATQSIEAPPSGVFDAGSKPSYFRYRWIIRRS